MAKIVKEIKLETSKQNIIPAIVAKQNDCDSRFLKVTFLDEGKTIPLKLSSKVTINAERKDGESNSFFGEVNGDNTATVPLHSWMLELDGIVNCDVSIIDIDGRKLTTTTFVVMVEKAAHGADDISTKPQYEVLVNLIDEVNETKVGVANAIKVSASGNPVCITDSSNLEHEIKVKLGGSEDEARGFYIEEVFNSSEMDQFASDITESGIYVIESVFTSEDSDMTEITFKDGKEVKTTWIEGEPFAEGDMVYVEVNGDNKIFSIMRGATVQKYGKNLVDVDKMLNKSLTKDENGIYRISKGSSKSYKFATPIPANTSFVLSYKNLEGYNANSNALISHSIYFADGTVDGGNWVGGKWKDGNAFDSKLVIKKSKPVTGFIINTYNPSADYHASFTGLQIEIGTTPTEYEPYQNPEPLTADENGIVNGIVSNGESMTLIAEDGVTIDAEYNVDTKTYIDKKFAELAAMIVNS